MSRIYVLTIAIVISGMLSGGIYSVSAGNGTALIINRFTGGGWYCHLEACSLFRNFQ